MSIELARLVCLALGTVALTWGLTATIRGYLAERKAGVYSSLPQTREDYLVVASVVVGTMAIVSGILLDKPAVLAMTVLMSLFVLYRYVLVDSWRKPAGR
jgi:hypothetical protein